MKHKMFSVLLFDHQEAHTLRIQYFIETIKYLLKNMRIPFLIKDNSI